MALSLSPSRRGGRALPQTQRNPHTPGIAAADGASQPPTFPMQTRPLGRTGLHLPVLSFGASSLGAEFRSVTLDEALTSVRVALECGLNFIDTSPFYGRGMSEVLLGIALRAYRATATRSAPSSAATTSRTLISRRNAWLRAST